MENYNIDKINKKVINNVKKLIVDTESEYRGQLFYICKMAIEKRSKIILVAGPSCAGKTTSARLMKEILEQKGYNVLAISMDDFFLNREDTPFLENGMRDLDSINALNLPLMKKCFNELFSKGEAWFPQYNFLTGINNNKALQYKINDHSIIIFEGLHTLNPKLIECIGTKSYLKLYINTLSGFTYKNYDLSPQNLRLLRRIIRDTNRRGYSPAKTLQMWDNVTDAETKYITPYKDDCDASIDTTHKFELALYKPYWQELEKKYPQLSDLSFDKIVDKSKTFDKSMLPETTLMWEFLDK